MPKSVWAALEGMESINRRIKAIDSRNFWDNLESSCKKEKRQKIIKKDFKEKASSQYDEVEKLFERGSNKKDYNKIM